MKSIAWILAFFSVSTLAQNLDDIEKDLNSGQSVQSLSNVSKSLSLQQAIEIGLRKNINQKLQSYEFQLNEITFKDQYQDFWFPKLSLSITTSNDHFTENLYRDVSDNAESSKNPTGTIRFGFDDYTLFNWGKDYLTYINNKEIYERQKEKYKEEDRDLRFQIIAEYFNLSRQYQIVQATKKQLNHTSFVYRLAKEKLTARKASTQEFYQAKALFLDSHKEYQDSLFTYYQIQENLANLLGDDITSTYYPQDILKYKALNIDSVESLKLALANNSSIKDARVETNTNSRLYEKKMKENLPLPKFSVKLGNYYRPLSNSGYSDNYETFSNSKNIEVAATINMTWTIFGSGGLFNSRVKESSYYQKRIAEIKLLESHREVKVKNRLTHSRIRYLEKKFKAAEADLKNSRLVFDKTIDNYIANKTDFSNIYQVLNDLLLSTKDFHNTKYAHLVEKLTMSQIMGVNDFPGEKFDNLVIKQ